MSDNLKFVKELNRMKLAITRNIAEPRDIDIRMLLEKIDNILGIDDLKHLSSSGGLTYSFTFNGIDYTCKLQSSATKGELEGLISGLNIYYNSCIESGLLTEENLTSPTREEMPTDIGEEPPTEVTEAESETDEHAVNKDESATGDEEEEKAIEPDEYEMPDDKPATEAEEIYDEVAHDYDVSDEDGEMESGETTTGEKWSQSPRLIEGSRGKHSSRIEKESGSQERTGRHFRNEEPSKGEEDSRGTEQRDDSLVKEQDRLIQMICHRTNMNEQHEIDIMNERIARIIATNTNEELLKVSQEITIEEINRRMDLEDSKKTNKISAILGQTDLNTVIDDFKMEWTVGSYKRAMKPVNKSEFSHEDEPEPEPGYEDEDMSQSTNFYNILKAIHELNPEIEMYIVLKEGIETIYTDTSIKDIKLPRGFCTSDNSISNKFVNISIYSAQELKGNVYPMPASVYLEICSPADFEILEEDPMKKKAPVNKGKLKEIFDGAKDKISGMLASLKGVMPRKDRTEMESKYDDSDDATYESSEDDYNVPGL